MDSNYERPLPISTFIGMKNNIVKKVSEKEAGNEKLTPWERAIEAARRSNKNPR